MKIGQQYTRFCDRWIDEDYEQMRHAMQDGSMAKFHVIYDQLLVAPDRPERESETRIGLHWPGIVVTDAPSPELVSKAE